MGKKSVDWTKDPVILARLPKVEDLHIKGALNTQIARALNVDEITIRRDLKRLNTLWKERVGADVEEQRARATAVYRKVQIESWKAANNIADKSMVKVSYLNTVKAAEDSIAKILGTEAPTKRELSGPDGGPITHSVTYDLSRLSDEELEALDRITGKLADTDE